MEKLVVEENGFIKEEIYQRIKKEMNKKEDWFVAEQLKTLERELKKLT